MHRPPPNPRPPAGPPDRPDATTPPSAADIKVAGTEEHSSEHSSPAPERDISETTRPDKAFPAGDSSRPRETSPPEEASRHDEVSSRSGDGHETARETDRETDRETTREGSASPAESETTEPSPSRDSVAKEFPTPTPAPSGKRAHKRLLDDTEADGFRDRWHTVQAAFVDDPADSARRAEELAAEVVNALGRAIAGRKHDLDASAKGRGEDGEGPDTERLRQSLRAYRDLVDRLLAV